MRHSCRTRSGPGLVNAFTMHVPDLLATTTPMSHDSLFSPMTADPYPRYPGPSEVSTHANRASTHLRAAASVDVLASSEI